MIRSYRGGKSTYLVVLTQIIEKPRTREWLIKNLPSLKEKTIDANLHYLKEWGLIKKSGNEYALINYENPDNKMELAIKQTLLERLTDDIYTGEEIYLKTPVYSTDLDGNPLATDEIFISEVAMNYGSDPKNSEFRERYFRIIGEHKKKFILPSEEI